MKQKEGLGEVSNPFQTPVRADRAGADASFQHHQHLPGAQPCTGGSPHHAGSHNYISFLQGKDCLSRYACQDPPGQNGTKIQELSPHGITFPGQSPLRSCTNKARGAGRCLSGGLQTFPTGGFRQLVGTMPLQSSTAPAFPSHTHNLQARLTHPRGAGASPQLQETAGRQSGAHGAGRARPHSRRAQEQKFSYLLNSPRAQIPNPHPSAQKWINEEASR